MIQRAKIKQIHGTAVVLVLGGFLIAGPVQAQTPDAVSAATSVPTKDVGINVGTAVGNASAANGAPVMPTTLPKDFSSSLTTPSSTLAVVPTADQTIEQERSRTLKATALRILDSISKHPVGREVKVPDWRTNEDKAIYAARDGHYDDALAILDGLHKEHPEIASIAIDQATVLAWAGRDADAVAAYKALPAGGERPDYLIDAIGHAYRNLHQPEDALTVYRAGLQAYPDNQSFMGGEIFGLLESGHTDEAIARAQEAQNKIAAPSEPLALAIKEANHVNAIALARGGHYKEALPLLASLHEKYPSDISITADDVAVLSWAGHDTEAVALFKTLPGDQPDYVLDAAAHSYRNLRQPKAALDLYQSALDKNPDNVTYAVGVIYCLSDLNRDSEALRVAQEQIAKHPEKPVELVKAYTYVERRHAISLARAGHYEQALKLLRELRAKYPNDSTEVMDYIAVSGWAGHDKDAVKEYEKIARQKMPDYVLEAVGHSYRNLHQTEKALVVYRRGGKQSPRNEIFAAGEIRCLDDLGRYKQGVARATAYTAAYGGRLDVLLAGGEAANLDEQPIVALDFYQRALAISPRNREGLRGLVHSEDRAGASELALKHADKHPGLMSGVEYRTLVGDSNSDLVRWGALEQEDESMRYEGTDEALEKIDRTIAAWRAKNDPALAADIRRARIDRLVALRDRSRMQDVVGDYADLAQEGIEVPTYALVAVGDAYLYLRQPEVARDVFLKVLQTEPKNYEARRLLAYAYLENEQVSEAYATIDQLREDQPQWVYLKGEPERQPNPLRAQAELDAGEIRSHAGEQQDANDRLKPVTEAATFDPRAREAAGNLAIARGWPRKAMENYAIGTHISDQRRDAGNETGITMADMDLQRFPEADKDLSNLVDRFPELLGTQRAQRLWDVHNMAELDAHAGYAFAPLESKTDVNSPHGQGFNVGAELYSAPIDYNWRLFAGEDFFHEHEPNEEAHADYSRTNAGVEYRKENVTASVAPTFNNYEGRERLGGVGAFKYAFNDMWSAGISAALFAGDTPLRALAAGITANEYKGEVTWRQSESRSLAVDASAMTFSDQNVRTAQNAEYIERLYTDPNFQVDAEGNLALTQDSKDENRLYFNPSADVLALVGARVTHTLYRHYETQWQHSLLAMAGLYAQEHYGMSPAWTVRYEHRFYYNDTTNAGVGVNYVHQDYDGLSSDAVSLTMDVVERF